MREGERKRRGERGLMPRSLAPGDRLRREEVPVPDLISEPVASASGKGTGSAYSRSLSPEAGGTANQNFTFATSTSSLCFLRMTVCRSVTSFGVPAKRVTVTLTCVSPASRFGLVAK